jgi:hypothetical protein
MANATSPSAASPQQRIAAIHAWYCSATGQNIRLLYDRERLWSDIFLAGFTEQDIRRVVRYLRREIAERRRNQGALILRNMLAIDRFEEDLGLSRVDWDPERKLPPLPS